MNVASTFLLLLVITFPLWLPMLIDLWEDTDD